MQRGDRLMLEGLDRHRVQVLVPVGFEEPLRIGPVSLAAAHVGSHIVSWEQVNGVPQGLQLSRLVMRGSTRLEHDDRRRPLREELDKVVAGEPPLFIDAARPMGHCDLKHRLCQINGDGRMLHLDSSLPWPSRGRLLLAP